MAADLWNIFLNVIAAFVYAGIVWAWQNQGSRSSRFPPQPLPLGASAPPSPGPSTGRPDRRVRNRQALTRAAHRFLFYVTTFGVLYLSVTMPPLFKALFTKGEVLLSDARFIGHMLPSVPIDKSYLQVTFFLIAATLYLPLLEVAKFLTSLLFPVIDKLLPVTERIWSASVMLVFLVFCIPVAATSIWLFFEKSYQDAFLMVLFVLFLVFALGQSQGGRR